MARLLLVDEMVSQVRSQIDEENIDTVNDVDDILPALNRGLNYAADTLARHYEEPLLHNYRQPLSSGVQEYDFREDTYSDRIEKVEIEVGNDYVECIRISYRDISRYESKTLTNIPKYYAVIGRKIRLVNAPTGTYPARVWYLQAPEKLVMPQGRITSVNTASNYVIVDQVGDDLTTEVDSLNSYVNIVDGQTGRVKCTMQIKNISGNRITWKTVPARTTVLNRNIEVDMLDIPDLYLSPDETGTITIDKDDYLCSYEGSCVLYFKDPTANFVMQFAISAMKRKVGDSADTEQAILKQFEDQLEHTWVGREQSLRIKKRNSIWGRSRRRRINR